MEAFPIEIGDFQTLRGSAVHAFVGRWVFCDRRCSEHRLPSLQVTAAHGSHALTSPLCCGPKMSAARPGPARSNPDLSEEDCWFSIPQAGSVCSPIQERMASFLSTAVVLLDAS